MFFDSIGVGKSKVRQNWVKNNLESNYFADLKKNITNFSFRILLSALVLGSPMKDYNRFAYNQNFSFNRVAHSLKSNFNRFKWTQKSMPNTVSNKIKQQNLEDRIVPVSKALSNKYSPYELEIPVFKKLGLGNSNFEIMPSKINDDLNSTSLNGTGVVPAHKKKKNNKKLFSGAIPRKYKYYVDHIEYIYGKYGNTIETLSKTYKVPLEVLLAVIGIEHGHDEFGKKGSVSPTGAIGPMQLFPAAGFTAVRYANQKFNNEEHFGIDDYYHKILNTAENEAIDINKIPKKEKKKYGFVYNYWVPKDGKSFKIINELIKNPKSNLKLGTIYLKFLHDRYFPDWSLAVPAYHDGQGKIMEYVKYHKSLKDPNGNPIKMGRKSIRNYIMEKKLNFYKLFTSEVKDYYKKVRGPYDKLNYSSQVMELAAYLDKNLSRG